MDARDLDATDALIVTPFTGVWIEILISLSVSLIHRSHTLHGCVD